MNLSESSPEFNLPAAIGAGTENLTMSSREIAELCEKRHDNVKRDIEKMLADIGFDALKFEDIYQDSRGRDQKEFSLPRDLTVTLIAGYRADLRYRVVKRLEELEAAQAQHIALTGPQLMAAALIETDATMKAQAAQIEDMREDVEAHARISKADGSFNGTEAAKSLGIRPKDLFQWLSSNGWLYKRPGSPTWLGYQVRCNAGDLEHKTTTVLRADGSERITEQVRITAKGLAKLAKLVPSVAREVV